MRSAVSVKLEYNRGSTPSSAPRVAQLRQKTKPLRVDDPAGSAPKVLKTHHEGRMLRGAGSAFITFVFLGRYLFSLPKSRVLCSITEHESFYTHQCVSFLLFVCPILALCACSRLLVGRRPLGRLRASEAKEGAPGRGGRAGRHCVERRRTDRAGDVC